MRTILISFVIFNLALSGFCIAQDNGFEAPESFEEAQQMGEKVLDVGKKELPGIVKNIWNENVLPVWQKMYDWFYTNIWSKIKNLFGSRIEKEIETRKEIFEEEFEQEKKEVKKEAPGLFNYIRKFIRDIVKKFKILWK